MPPAADPAVRRRLVVAGVAVPVTLALTLPAYARPSVEVTASEQPCALVLSVEDLPAGEHEATLVVTSTATGEVVPALPDEDEDAQDAAAGESDAAAGGTDEAAGAQDGDASVTAELVLTEDDNDLVVALDPQAVPDDGRVEVEVLLDGQPAADLALTLTGCGPVVPGAPTPAGTSSPTPTGTPSGSPNPTATPSGSPSPSGSPTPTGSPTPSGSPTPGPSATPTASGSPAVAAPTASPTPRVPVPSAPAPSPRSTGTTLPSVDDSSPTSSTANSDGGAVLGGTGSSGYLPSLSWGTSPQAAPVAPVPAPVIAPPVGGAAVSSGELVSSSRPLDELLAVPQERSAVPSSDEADVALAVPRLSTAVTTPDPLVDLAPAAFVLAAWLGGVLSAGRRRTR